MSISTGGISNTSPIPDDLVAIYQGGQYFLDRMKVFEKTKADAEAAYAQLQLGHEVLGAHADAKAKQEAAIKLHEDAKAVLDKANTEAKDTITIAKSQADSILVEARRKHDELVGTASSIKSDAEIHAAKLKSEAEEIHKDAVDRLQEASVKAIAAQAKSDTAEAAKVAADAARSKHDSARTTYEQKMAKIMAVMAPT